MAGRADALVAAAEFVLRVTGRARDGAVATVGALEVEPGRLERDSGAGHG